MNDGIFRGEIYWIHKGYHTQTVGGVMNLDKARPGIIVSNDLINDTLRTCQIVYLTTSPQRDIPTHCTTRSSYEVSTALCEQITTIDKSQIGRYIGRVSPQEMEAVERCMLISLGIESMAEEWDENEKEAGTEDSTYDSECRAKSTYRDADEAIASATAQITLLKSMYNDLLAKYLNR